MVAKLVGQSASDKAVELGLRALPITLGRGDEADVCINDRWASRLHCEITEFYDGLNVRDLGSTHGTFVNGEAVQVSVLREGDELTIGMHSFILRFEASLAKAENEGTSAQDGRTTGTESTHPQQPR